MSEATRYVWNGESCILCTDRMEASLYAMFAGLCALLVCVALMIVGFKWRREGSWKTSFSQDRLEAFYEKFLVKYKVRFSIVHVKVILVVLTKVL